MENLKMHSPDLTQGNIDRLAELFPNCVTESRDEKGSLKRAIDFDLLRQELANHIVEGPQERYRLDWPGKREALLTANAPIAKTLRPCREESVDFDTTKNLFIEGDNLDALKLLQENYLGKVKMIYIDPPYNTGNDFIYEDNFAENTEEFLKRSNQKDEKGNRLIANTESNGRFHSDWLSMMYPRLKLARNLLVGNGLIFVSSDENEAFNLKKMLDEIFGSENCINDIVWKNRYNAAKEKHLAIIHEYIFVYAKSKEKIGSIYVPPTEHYISRYFKYKDAKYSIRGPYRLQPLEAGKSMDWRPNLVFEIPAPDGQKVLPKRQWKWREERVREALINGELEFVKSNDGWGVSTKQYLKDNKGQYYGVKPFTLIDDIFTQVGTKEIADSFGSVSFFPFPKPTPLLIHLMNIAGTKDNDIVFDFFSGSATTAHAVMQLNAEDGGKRRYIMVQLPEPCDEKSEAFKAGYKTIAEIGKERIRRAGKKIREENPITTTDLDIGFRVLKVDSSNMADIYYTPDAVSQDRLLFMSQNIKENRTPEDLLFQVLLDWGVDLSLPVTKVKIMNKDVFFVDGNALAACFDQDDGITEEFVKEIAKREPLRAVFRDAGFKDDSVKINVEQIFKSLSPHTEVKTI